MTSLLAIDFGAHCGWAYWEDEQLKKSDAIDGRHAFTPFTLINRLLPTQIVLENWYQGKQKRGFKNLAYHHDLWRALGEAMQMPVHIVAANTWQSWVKKRLGYEAVAKQLDGLNATKRQKHKQVLKLLATQLTRRLARNYPAPKDDEADAILIGWWAVETNLGVKSEKAA